MRLEYNVVRIGEITQDYVQLWDFILPVLGFQVGKLLFCYIKPIYKKGTLMFLTSSLLAVQPYVVSSMVSQQSIFRGGVVSPTPNLKDQGLNFF
jgi:hypothetical protein